MLISVRLIGRISPWLLVVLQLAAGCIRNYEPPKEGQPSALLKTQFSYNETLSGTNMGVAIFIREGPDESLLRVYINNVAHIDSGADPPRVPAHGVAIRPIPETSVYLRLYFSWTTQQQVQVSHRDYEGNTTYTTETQTQYHERGCTAGVTFAPAVGNSYLVNYSGGTIDQDCIAQAFLQTLADDGTFSLEAVGVATVEE